MNNENKDKLKALSKWQEIGVPAETQRTIPTGFGRSHNLPNCPDIRASGWAINSFDYG
jgi:hypothetical protein